MKIKAQEAGWKCLSSKTIHESPWKKILADRVQFPNGQKGEFTYLCLPDSVFIVPVTREGEIVLIRSYRYTIDEWCWEVPAGSTGDKPTANLTEVAKQELLEETGASTNEELVFLGQFFMGNGHTSTKTHFYLARNVVLDSPPQLDAGETIDQIRKVSLDEVQEMILQGEVNDGDSAFALLLALKYLNEK